MNQSFENSQKRGRPKLEEISSLIKEGSQSKSPIRCRFCKRAFPREKSLQAHQRIHTGERPYRCTHAGCHKSFVQSGQLRTHQRLHTGEKPFRCNECKNRFTHANRRCPDHPSAGVVRDESLTGGNCSPSIVSSSAPSISPIILVPAHDLKTNLIPAHNAVMPTTTTTTTAATTVIVPTRSALCNYENNLSYHLNMIGAGGSGGALLGGGSSRCYERRDEILGALALIELSRCH